MEKTLGEILYSIHVEARSLDKKHYTWELLHS